MNPSTVRDAAAWLRAMRCARRISQREFAELAGVPRTTIGRIEAGATTPRFDTFAVLVAAAGYEISILDRHARQLGPAEEHDEPVDRGGRRFPAHLGCAPTPGYFDPIEAGLWWGWHNIAWPYTDDWVPAHTYWRRRELPQYEGRDVYCREKGRVWDDAT